MGDSVNIPQYSASVNVIKLYDNMYFDNKNGNLIEIDAPAFVETSVTPSVTQSSTSSVAPYATPSSSIITNVSDLLSSPTAINYKNDLHNLENDFKNTIQTPASQAMIKNLKTDVQNITSSPQVAIIMDDVKNIQASPQVTKLVGDVKNTQASPQVVKLIGDVQSDIQNIITNYFEIVESFNSLKKFVIIIILGSELPGPPAK
jgi:hypothetical protein